MRGAASPLLAQRVVDVNTYRTGQSWHIRGALFTLGVWASLVGLLIRIVVEIAQAADDVTYEWGAIDVLWFLPIFTYVAYLIEACCSSTRKYVANAGDENASETVVAQMKCSAPRFTMHVQVSPRHSVSALPRHSVFTLRAPTPHPVAVVLPLRNAMAHRHNNGLRWQDALAPGVVSRKSRHPPCVGPHTVRGVGRLVNRRVRPWRVSTGQTGALKIVRICGRADSALVPPAACALPPHARPR